jgi:hypothetical protein
MTPGETILGMGEGGINENGGGVNWGMIYLIYCKNLCRSHNVPPPSTTTAAKDMRTLNEKSNRGE